MDNQNRKRKTSEIRKMFRINMPVLWSGPLAVRVLSAITLVSCLFLTACHVQPWSGFPAAQQPLLVWPATPEQARVEYVMEIKSHADLYQRQTGFWKSIGELITGGPDSVMLRPFALAIHPKGGLLVTDTGLQLVHYYDWNSQRYLVIGPRRPGGLPSPVGVAATSDNRILVSDSRLGSVEEFNDEGDWIGTFNKGYEFGRPAGIAIEPITAEVYVADVINHKIVVFDNQGNYLRSIGKRGDGNNEWNFPTHLGMGSGQKLAVTDSMNFRVQLLQSDGSFIQSIGRLGNAPGQFAKPKGVAIDQHGNLIVVESLHSGLEFFNPQGQLLLHIGQSGNAPGEFWLPSGLAFMKGENLLFVADNYNSRVQVFHIKD